MGIPNLINCLIVTKHPPLSSSTHIFIYPPPLFPFSLSFILSPSLFLYLSLTSSIFFFIPLSLCHSFSFPPFLPTSLSLSPPSLFLHPLPFPLSMPSYYI